MDDVKLDEDKKLTEEKIIETLNYLYEQVLSGIPKTKNCYELADEFLSRYNDPEKAAKIFIRYQVIKCTATGFLTSLGGIITLPITVPADLAVTWYIQLRMIAVIAAMNGFDPGDESVRALVYACVTGTSVTKILKEAGVKIADKAVLAVVKKIPGKALIAINKKVGFRLFTKFGTKGVINIGKCVPIVGGIVGGGLDLAETQVIASMAYKTFILQELDAEPDEQYVEATT